MAEKKVSDTFFSLLECDLAGLGATAALARALAERARPGDVYGLRGELGVGKTTLARFFVGALAGPETEVPSPTFTLVQTYESPAGTIWHFDLYRLESPEDAYELGIEDAFADGISLIEWPDRLGPLLPADTLDLWLRHGASAGARRVRLAGGGEWPERLQDGLGGLGAGR